MLFRCRVAWTGANIVGGGVSTLFHEDTATASAVPAAVKSIFTACKALFPPGITWTIQGSGDIINPADGSLQGAWNGGADLTEVSSGTNTSGPNGVGASIEWGTSTIVGKRRARGRLFMAPLSGACYLNGLLTTSAQSTLLTAGNAYIATASTAPVVWNRPVVKNNVVQRTGTFSPILTSKVPLNVAFLRSRKQ